VLLSSPDSSPAKPKAAVTKPIQAQGSNAETGPKQAKGSNAQQAGLPEYLRPVLHHFHVRSSKILLLTGT
jgi:hypothetical protein